MQLPASCCGGTSASPPSRQRAGQVTQPGAPAAPRPACRTAAGGEQGQAAATQRARKARASTAACQRGRNQPRWEASYRYRPGCRPLPGTPTHPPTTSSPHPPTHPPAHLQVVGGHRVIEEGAGPVRGVGARHLRAGRGRRHRRGQGVGGWEAGTRLGAAGRSRAWRPPQPAAAGPGRGPRRGGRPAPTRGAGSRLEEGRKASSSRMPASASSSVSNAPCATPARVVCDGRAAACAVRMRVGDQQGVGRAGPRECWAPGCASAAAACKGPGGRERAHPTWWCAWWRRPAPLA